MPPVPAYLAKFATKFNDAAQFKVPAGQQFPRISIGRSRFTAIDADGEETVLGHDDFEFIAVDANPHTSKVYFATTYTGDEDATPPSCWSDNGQYPDVRTSRPHCESCALCNLNMWGSATSNKTGKDVKACLDLKKLAVLPLHDEVEGVHMFRVSPAALKNWSRYVNELRKIGGDCGFEVTPSLVITRAIWVDTNIMGFEFVDFLDEELGEYVAGLKEEKGYDQWIGTDNQSQTYPMLAAEPRSHQQRLMAPAKELEPIQDAEVVETKPVRSATARRGVKTEPVRDTRRPSERIATEAEPSQARAEMVAGGKTQGERKMTPMEIAKARARGQMGRPAA
jgi:hypothetical protein